MNKFIYLGVNYNSIDQVGWMIKEWACHSKVSKIYIVDSYSTDQERSKVTALCQDLEIELIQCENLGYGNCLNYGLKKILDDNFGNSEFESQLVLFGNVDVLPLSLETSLLDPNLVPIVNVNTKGKEENPFITKFQSYFLWIPCLAAFLKSPFILKIWLLVYKLSKFVPSETYAVHGSLFCLNGKQIIDMHPIFDTSVFMYCEEMFFARSVRKLKLKFYETNIKISHAGAVSTGKMFNVKKFAFRNWVSSMRTYCNGG